MKHKNSGVRPDQIIDYLALMGDKVDNVPGVETRPENGGEMAGKLRLRRKA